MCLLCGLNRVLRSKKRAETRGISEYLQWASFDVKDAVILQVREGGGKKAGSSGNKGRGKAPGVGFHLVPDECLSFAEVISDPEYSGVMAQMKDQLLTVIKQSLELGFIKRSEI